MIVNPLGKSGGLVPIIKVTAPTGSTVTCDSVQGTESSGTWTFNVAIGTHTIVASKDGSTKTETVVVDEVGLYTITITYMPEGALYWLGDECTDITGGWTLACQYSYSESSHGTISKESDYLLVNCTGRGYFSSFGWGTTNLIDISNYTTLNILFGTCTCGLQGGFGTGTITQLGRSGTSVGGLWETTDISNTTISLSTSEYTSSPYFIAIIDNSGNKSTGTMQIKKVWLE